MKTPTLPAKPISTRLHGLIDCAAGATLALAPVAAGWGGTTRRLAQSAALGTAAYMLLTDYEAGSAPLLDMDQHLALDAVQGLGFIAAAGLLAGEPKGARYAMAGYGLFALTVAALTERHPGPARPATRPSRRAEAELIRREAAARQWMGLEV